MSESDKMSRYNPRRACAARTPCARVVQCGWSVWERGERLELAYAMDPPAEKKAKLYFGSLEEQERLRLQTGGAAFSSALREGILSGNINLAPTGMLFIGYHNCWILARHQKAACRAGGPKGLLLLSTAPCALQNRNQEILEA